MSRSTQLHFHIRSAAVNCSCTPTHNCKLHFLACNCSYTPPTVRYCMYVGRVQPQLHFGRLCVIVCSPAMRNLSCMTVDCVQLHVHRQRTTQLHVRELIRKCMLIDHVQLQLHARATMCNCMSINRAQQLLHLCWMCATASPPVVSIVWPPAMCNYNCTPIGCAQLHVTGCACLRTCMSTGHALLHIRTLII